MLLEEFYNYDSSGDQLIAESMYLHTLGCWLINNDFTIYESLVKHYEEIEQYEVCEGITRALDKIEDIMDKHFSEAEKFSETDKEVTYTHQEHMRVSALIYEDILKEIYEKQINKRKEDNRKGSRS